jgi:hypothetical protein
LHSEHASQRFSSSVRPPRASGIRWSISIGEPTMASRVKQYPQRRRASAETFSRSILGMCVLLIPRRRRVSRRRGRDS